MRLLSVTSTDLYQRWQVPIVTGALALGWVVIYLDRSILFPTLPAIAADLGLSGTQLGLIPSAYFLVYVAMQLPSGLLGDRLGLKRVMLGFYCVIGLGLVGIGLFSISYSLLLLFVAIHGFGAGAYFSGSYGITLSSVPPRRRAPASAVVTAGLSTGFALGLALGGALYALTNSWRAPFLIMLLPTAIAIGVLVTALPQTQSLHSSERSVGSLLRNRSFLAIGAVYFCTQYGNWVVFTWTPSFLHSELGMDLPRAGLYTAIAAFASVPGGLLWAPLSARLGIKQLTVALCVVAAVMILVFPQVRSMELLPLVLAAYGFFGGNALVPLLVAWAGGNVLRLGTTGAGTAMGMLNTMALSSSFIAPAVSGVVLDVSGSLTGAFYLGAVIYLVAVFVGVFPKEAVSPR